MPDSRRETELVDSPPARRVSVMLPLPLAGAYDYCDPGLGLTAGDIVRVPLGRRESIGVVWDQGGDAAVPEERLKPVIARFECPPMPESLRRHVDWVAGYTLSPPGAVLRMALSSPSALEPAKPRLVYGLGEDAMRSLSGGAPPLPDVRLTPARRRVLIQMRDLPSMPLRELAAECGVGPSVIKALVESGAIVPHAVDEDKSGPVLDWRRPGPALSDDQRAAADSLSRKAGAGGFSATLLDGVTGSGKTEVYFEAIAAALAAGRQVLVLLPEIALSAQWLDRFAQRFGAHPAAWHSDVPQAERRRTWRGVAEGRIPVVVGARSALFLPFPALGLIVVDEEHESAFKQEDGVVYHARDMAVVRAHLSDIPVVLVSATPSLESVANVAAGKYDLLRLPGRHGGAALPKIEVVDLRSDRPERGQWLSPTLARAVAETLGAGEQVMLYLNRRGYAPLTVCRACGHRLQCPHCTAWLVEHRLIGRLQCHHCGFRTRMPDVCPSCSQAESFAACGPGVERLQEEVVSRFTLADGTPLRIAVMTSDTITGPDAAAQLVRAVRAHEVDLVIGTQMMAKGHHFPMLTLVGVVDADLGLTGGDLRASERTYQVLHQVAGRAGREGRPGRAILQTMDPDNRVIAALVSGDRDRFLAEEAEERQRSGMPPYGRLVAVIVSSPDCAEAEGLAFALARSAPRMDGMTILGPAPAPLSVLRGRHRFRLLVKAARSTPVQRIIRTWIQSVRTHGKSRVQIDVDPYSFL